MNYEIIKKALRTELTEAHLELHHTVRKCGEIMARVGIGNQPEVRSTGRQVLGNIQDALDRVEAVRCELDEFEKLGRAEEES